jgi:hypothetical protein
MGEKKKERMKKRKTNMFNESLQFNIESNGNPLFNFKVF